MSDTSRSDKRAGSDIDFSQLNWQDLLEQAPIFVCVVARDGRILSLNRPFPGFDVESSVGRKLQEFATQEDAPAVGAAIERTFETGEPCQVSACGANADGVIREFVAHLAPIRFENVVAGVTVVAQDVTEQSRNRERVAEQEARLQSVFKAAPVGIGLTVNRVVKQANRRLCDMLGYDHGELAGMDARWLYPDEAEYERVGREKYGQIERYGVGTIETKWVRKDKEVVDVLLSSSPIDSSDLSKGVIFTALDISDSLRARKALEDSERRLREITDGIPGAVYQFVMDRDGSVHIPYMSKSATALFERSITDLTDDKKLFDDIHPDDIDNFWESIQESAKQRTQWTCRFRICFPDGRIKWLRGASSPLGQSDGCIVWNGVLLDVTQQYEAREELQRSRELLATAERIARYGSWDWNLITHEVVWSEVLFELYGRDPRKGPPSVENWLDNVHPEDREELDRAVRDALAGERPYSIEWRQIREDTREVRYLHAEGEVLRDDSGRPCRMTGIARDITDQREAEDRLRFKARILDSVNDATIATDPHGRITYWNKGAERLYGWTADEVLGRSIVEVTPTDQSREQARAIMSQLQAGKKWAGEFKVRDKDGHEFPIAITDWPILDDNGELLGVIGISNDITERREAEEALRESEEKYRQLVENSTAGIAVAQDRYLRYVNPQLINGVGYSEEYIKSKPFSEFVHPDDRTRVIENHRKRMLGQPAEDAYELRIVDSQGRSRWYFARAVDSSWEGKRAVLYFLDDVTERKDAEEALRHRLALERLVSSLSSEFAGVHTDDIDSHIDAALSEIGRFSGVDRSYVFLFSEDGTHMSNTHEWCADGITPEAMRLQNVPVDSFPWLMSRLRRFESVSVPRVADLPNEASAEKRDFEQGGVRSLICVPIYQYDNLMGLLGLDAVRQVRDWSDDFETLLRMVADTLANALERKRGEEALRRSEERFRAVFETARDAIFIKDTECRYISINPAMERLFGQPASSLIGKTDTELFGAEAGEHIESIDNRVLAGGYVEEEHTKPVRGEEHTFHVIKVPMRDANRRVVGLCGIARDITQKRRMEDELARADKLESVGLLAGGIAHDFNNILTGVVGSISLAKLDVAEDSPLYELLDEADRALMRSRDLTRQLLTFSRGGAPVKQAASLADVVRDCADFSLRGSNVRCRYNLPEDLRHVEVDIGQISQVINNLVINADQAMPEGGDLTITAENVNVRPDFPMPLKPGRYVSFSITDEGTGVPPDLLPKVFDPFFTTKQKGNGLGLASAYSIVHKHGGHIECDSVLGKGTTFRVYLPASEKRVQKKTEKKTQTVPGSGRVLVMDDEEVVRNIAGHSLRKWGYEVEFASDGEEAVALYREALEQNRRFDAVILDLTVPGGIGGRETVGRLRKIDPDVRAIVCSGYSNDPALGDYEKAGFVGIVGKPFKPKELAGVVQEAIEGAGQAS